MSSSSDTLLNENQETKNLLLIIKSINIFWLIMTLIVFAVLINLGLWQSSRAIEKEQRLSRIASLNTTNPISLQQVVALSNTENINDFPVNANGVFIAEKVFLLDNQVSGGRLGYQVLQILMTEKNAVLVNLGWVQGSINRQELPEVSGYSGEINFSSKVRLVEPNIQLMAQDFSSVQWPLRVQQIELDKFSALLDKPLLPFVLYVNETDAIGFKKDWQAIVMPPEKHRGYAFQWFSLAIAWIMLMCWAAYSQRNKQ
ncbi:MAG: SURF1 family protein [Colwellia sp.]